MEKKKNRVTVGSFDLIKGIGMIAIILYHVCQLQNFPEVTVESNFVLYYVKRVGEPILMLTLPTLFIVSAYSLRKQDPIKFAKNQLGFVFKPYAITAVVSTILLLFNHYMVYGYLRGAVKEAASQFLGFVLAVPITDYWFDVKIYPNGPAWFVVALILSEILLMFMLKYVPEKIMGIVCFVMFFVGAKVYEYEPYLPFCLSRVLIITAALYLGFYLKKKKFFERKFQIWEIAVLLLSEVMYDVQLRPSVKFFIAGLCCVPLAHLGVILSSKVKLNGIRYIGRYSFYIMLIHTVDMMGILWYKVIDWCPGYPVLRYTIMCAVRLSAIIFVCWLIQKKPLSTFLIRKGYIDSENRNFASFAHRIRGKVQQ